MKFDRHKWAAHKKALLKHANELREDAAMSGSWSDGGGQGIIDLVSAVDSVLGGNMPDALANILTKLSKEQSEEYTLYTALKAKYENNDED